MREKGFKKDMKILYTGFKGKNNSSYQLLSSISGDKLYLTNSFEGLKRDINYNTDLYDFVVMFGLDKNLKNKIRIESLAESGGNIELTKVDINKVKVFFDNNKIKCDISDCATKYLCNAAYFYMLRKVGGKAVFIHIPTIRNMSLDMMEKMIKCMEDLRECAHSMKE